MIAALEIFAVAVVIILDFFIPTIIILGMIVISLLIRRENIPSLGFKKTKHGLQMASVVLLSVIVWQLLEIDLLMPVLNRLTGTRQDLSAFINLKGNLGQLLFYLALSWTLAALGKKLCIAAICRKGWAICSEATLLVLS